MSEAFWDSRAELALIRDYARSRRVAPWAVLGGVLARVCASTPPEVALPALVGSSGSLNLFVGIVAASGGGKGASQRVAAEVVRTPDRFDMVPVGSGEGVAAAYVHRETERDENGKATGNTSIVMHSDRVLFDIPEVDMLTALGKRTGATLLPVLRSAWSGETLGFQNADQTRRLPVEAHTYRFALTVGIQPGRAAALLDDSDGGTPQRFVWLPATDPSAPSSRPATPAPLDWEPPGIGEFTATGTPLRTMQVCRQARDEIDADRLARVRGDGAALDAHAMFARLKVAASLALLNTSAEITVEDWHLAAEVMTVSDQTRHAIQHDLAASAQRAATARAEARIAVADTVEESVVTRARARIIDKLTTEWQSAAPVRKNLARSLREVFDDAITALAADHLIEVRAIPGQGTSGQQLRLRGGDASPLPPATTTGVAGVTARPPNDTEGIAKVSKVSENQTPTPSTPSMTPSAERAA